MTTEWIKKSGINGLKHLTRGCMGIVTLKVTDNYDSDRHAYLAYCAAIAYTSYVIAMLKVTGMIAKCAIGIGTCLEMVTYMIVLSHVCFEQKEGEEIILVVVGTLVAVTLYQRFSTEPATDANQPEINNSEWTANLARQSLGMITELGGGLAGAAIAGFYKENKRTLRWLVIYVLIGYAAFKEVDMLTSGYIADLCFAIGFVAMFSLIVTSLLIFNMPNHEGLILLVCFLVVGLFIVPVT